jgi:3-ketosteroid 9alpha-monooxygenase subunit B
MLTQHDYHRLTITDVVTETADARTFVIAIPPELSEEFDYRAGQFCTFRASIDGDEVVRSYSMSSSPDVADPFAVTVKRVPGGRMSNWMIDTLGPGDAIDVLRPAGLFVLRDLDEPIVAFAGGSGITPVFSIVKTALTTTARPIRLVYANRDDTSVIFGAELAKLAADAEGRLDMRLRHDTLDGFLTPDDCAALAGGIDGDHYVCGPAAFMDVVEAGLDLMGADPANRFIERFAVPEAVIEGTDAADVAADAVVTEEIVYRLQRQKRSTDYKAGDTLLDTARRAGLRPPFSCEGGSCATCMARVEEGSAEMRVNNALTADEVAEGWVLTCQAVPTAARVVVNYDA